MSHIRYSGILTSLHLARFGNPDVQPARVNGESDRSADENGCYSRSR